ncbi:MAG: 30S ribosomal protein S17e [Nanoarchaeota archaeon]
MGRIKTTFIKRKTKELLKMHGEKFATDFEQNKKVASQYISGGSKKIRNVIAGYLTRLKKQQA